MHHGTQPLRDCQRGGVTHSKKPPAETEDFLLLVIPVSYVVMPGSAVGLGPSAHGGAGTSSPFQYQS